MPYSEDNARFEQAKAEMIRQRNQQKDRPMFTKTKSPRELQAFESAGKLEVAKYNQEQARRKYAASFSGKVQRGVTKGFSFIRSPARALYARPKSSTGATTNKGRGRPGRPFGTKDPRYSAYGGVYGYRKYISQQNALRRIQAGKMIQLTPEEQAIRARMIAQQQAKMANPEAATIPDTAGKTGIGSYTQEIDSYANLVD